MMSGAGATTTPELTAVVLPQRIDLTCGATPIVRYETTISQCLTIELGRRYWVYLDYRSNGPTNLRILTEYDRIPDDINYPWEAVKSGRGTVLVGGESGGEANQWWLSNLTVETLSPVQLRAGVSALAEMRSDPDIFPPTALCALQLQDALSSTLTQTRWRTFVGDEIETESLTLIEALAGGDYLEGDGRDVITLIESAYLNGHYRDPDPDVNIAIRHGKREAE